MIDLRSNLNTIIQSFYKKYEIYTFSNQQKITPGCKPNITTISSRGRSFYIPKNQMLKFISDYTELYNKCESHNLLRFAQFGLNINKFTVDVDLEKVRNPYIDNTDSRLVSDDIILSLCKIYITKLKSVLPTDIKIKNPYIFVMKKPAIGIKVTNDGKEILRDGFHLIITNLTFKHIDILNITKSVSTIAHNSILKKYDIKKTIDTSIYGSRPKWMMYGSSKNIKTLPYKIDYLINFDTCEKIDNFYTNKELIELSLIIHLDDPINLNIIHKPTPNIELRARHSIINYDDRFIKLIWHKLDSLSPHRYDGEDLPWRKVGWCLKSASNNNDNIYNLWLKFSKKSHLKYDKLSAKSTWDRGKENIYTWGTLNTWLKEDLKDDISLYNDIMKKDIIYQILTHNGPWGHLSVAKIVDILCDDKYKAVHTSKSQRISGYTFFEFIDHSWHTAHNSVPSSLWNIINTKLQHQFIIAKSLLFKKMSTATIDCDDDNLKRYSHQLKHIDNILLKLQSRSFRENIMIDCVTACLSPPSPQQVFDELNSNDNLTGFPNGVYDNVSDIFRHGKPEDNISVLMGGNYLHSIDQKIHDEMISSIKRVFPNDDVFLYVMKCVAQAVFEPRSRNKCIMFYGDGGSGKSKFMNFLCYSLNKYYSPLSMQYFTEKNTKSDAPSPSIMNLIHTRIVVASETNPYEYFNIQKFKQLTGGTMLSGRELYGIKIYFYWKGLLLMDLNDLVDLQIVDRSIERRIIIIPCNTIFSSDVEREKKRYPHRDRIFEKDDDYESKIKKWTLSGYFGTYLLNIYRTHVLNKKFNMDIMPKLIDYATTQYFYKYDLHRRFYDDRLLFTNNKRDKIKRTYLYNEYKQWAMKRNYYGKIKLCQNLLFQYFERNYQKYFNNKWLTHYIFQGDDNYDDLDDLDD